VTYHRVTPREHRTILTDAGVPLPQAEFVVALDGNARDGLLAGTSGELSALIGRATTSLRDGLAAALIPAEA
jgi:NAD(P)H dehydrogenase (quinone)